ncbi:MAG: D-glycerate dehydrogenase [Eubacteriales bacterium]|nr:D-glycerate dehydrogenase [Eubacteriales bacterium]
MGKLAIIQAEGDERMAKILVTHGVPMDRFALLAPEEVLAPKPGKAFTHEELLALLPDCDAVVTCGAMDRELMEACGKVQLMVSYGAGYDAIDMDAATELGIPVANIPGSVTESTAELAMAQLLTLLRRVSELNTLMREKKAKQKVFTMGSAMGVSPQGLTLGIVGMGRIGARMAEFGRFIGMRIVYTSRSIKPFSVAGNARRLPLDELLKQADVVSLHCPLTPETRGMIGARELALMRPTSFLLNTARGKLVKEEALCDALEQGRLAGAALDVFEEEPKVNKRLKALPNVVLTPHIGSNTLHTRNQMAEQCVQSIQRALAGLRPGNLLNPQVWPRK